MTYDLRVVFHGMHLYVPEGTEAMHVLMPSTGAPPSAGAACAGCIEAHAPRLIFDSAHVRPGSTTRDKAAVHCSLQNRKLQFPQAGSALNTALPPELARLDSPVIPEVLSGQDTDQVVARVSLRNGKWTDHAKGDTWLWNGQPQRLSHVVEWTVSGVPGDTLELPLEWLTGGVATPAVPKLHPVGGMIELAVWHAPYTELPPDSIIPPPPPPGGTAHHFSAYGKLLQAGQNPMPEYAPDRGNPIPNPGKYDDDDALGAATYSCMSATTGAGAGAGGGGGG